MTDDQTTEDTHYIVAIDRASGETEMHTYSDILDMARGAKALKPTLSKGDVARLFKQVAEQ